MTPPFYFVAASLPPGNRIKHFHHTDGSGPGRLLDHPKQFRYAGFDVSTGSVAALVDDHWEVRSGDRKLLSLYQDGTLIFRVRADEEFLGWGGQNLPDPGWINPVAAVESHLSFVHLYASVLPLAVTQPESVTLTVRLSNAVHDGRRLYLTQYYSGGIIHINNPQRYLAHSADSQSQLSVSGSQFVSAPDQVSFALLSNFYSLFDADQSLIPFQRHSSTGTEIDSAALSALR
jgi:hypothetical protein